MGFVGLGCGCVGLLVCCGVCGFGFGFCCWVRVLVGFVCLVSGFRLRLDFGCVFLFAFVFVLLPCCFCGFAGLCLHGCSI